MKQNYKKGKIIIITYKNLKAEMFHIKMINKIFKIQMNIMTNHPNQHI
jgi:hypothetical protein